MRKPLARPKIVRPKPALPPGVQAKRAQTDAVPPRDTQSKQEARSTRTRNAICEATIACLVEYGYGETTLGRVVEKAGVSNGALLHHFPSKEHLMTAAARHLLARTFERPKRRLPDNPTDRDVIATDLKTNWSYYINTPQYRALLEILIALRTDKTLRQQIAPTLHAYHEEAVRHISATYEFRDRPSRGCRTSAGDEQYFFCGCSCRTSIPPTPRNWRAWSSAGSRSCRRCFARAARRCAKFPPHRNAAAADSDRTECPLVGPTISILHQ